jgi:Xaa-Pro aminopeptidase
MGEGVMVIATAPEVPRNRDTYYPSGTTVISTG